MGLVSWIIIIIVIIAGAFHFGFFSFNDFDNKEPPNQKTSNPTIPGSNVEESVVEPPSTSSDSLPGESLPSDNQPIQTSNNSESASGFTGPSGEINTDVTASTNTISIKSSGYSPSTLTILQGVTVTWVNEDTRTNWPATDIHPTHRVYPDSDIEKCGTPEESQIFDACKALEKGESYSFTFNEPGTWNYHDHLRSSMKGKIIVQ